MPRRKTHHAANSPLRLPHQQACGIKLDWWNVRQHRWVIVVKNVGLRVRRCLRSPGARIARAQITGRIVRDCGRRLQFFNFSLPRPLRPMRRNHNPFAQQRIKSSMRDFIELVKTHWQVSVVGGACSRRGPSAARLRTPAKRRFRVSNRSAKNIPRLPCA